MSELKIKNIHSYYGDSYVLHGISLEVTEGKSIAVLGRNGAGKTTLVNSIMGFLHPRRGSILFNGFEISRLRPFQINRLGIGLVPQGRRVFGSLSTRENLSVSWRKSEGSTWSVEDVLSLFPRLRERLKSRAGDLSGGEQQMLAIGRTLVGNPSFLMLDEPTEGLSPMLVQEVNRTLVKLKSTNLPVLLVEQNIQFAVEVADYVYVLSKEGLVHECEASEFWKYREIMTKYLGV